MIKNKIVTEIFIFLILPLLTFAQQTEFPLQPVPITEWKADKGWQTAGSFSVNPFTKKTTSTSGNNVYVSDGTSGSLTTKQTYQDCQLSFDVMLSPNAEGIFNVWGLYGIMLSTKQHRMGGLLNDNGSFYAPLVSAERAPGIWQNIEIGIRHYEGFVADKNLIEYVKVNGLTVVQNVVVPAASQRGGSMVFKNVSGQLAVRDFKILSYRDVQPITVTSINYKFYDKLNDETKMPFADAKPSKTGTIPQLNYNLGLGRIQGNHAISYDITIDVAQDGNYAFLYEYAGNGAMSIDGGELLPTGEIVDRVPRVGYVSLKKGTHQIKLDYSKFWWAGQLGLFVSGDGIRPYPLHALSSFPERKAAGEISVKPIAEPEIIRSFFMHGEEKRTHVVSVGSPQRFHYAFDLDQGTMLAAWKGEFADVTNMWHERGEPQTLQPKGLTVTLSGKPAIMFKSQLNALPDSYEDVKDINYQTTRLTDKGEPVFVHKFNNRTLTQTIFPVADGLKYTMNIDGNTNDLIIRIAEGKSVEKLDATTFLVDNYFVRLPSGTTAQIVNNKEMKAIVVNAKATVSYTLSW